MFFETEREIDELVIFGCSERETRRYAVGDINGVFEIKQLNDKQFHIWSRSKDDIYFLMELHVTASYIANTGTCLTKEEYEDVKK